MNNKYYELNNGLKVVTIKSDNTKFATMNLAIKVGSMDESNEVKGVSHFLEHLMFNGTKTRNEKEIEQLLSMYAGNYNAFTYHDCTVYSLETLTEDFDIALEVYSDMIKNSIIKDESIEKERTVILSEIDMYADDIDSIHGSKTMEKAYEGQSLEMPVIGHRDVIEKIDRETIVEYYKKFYTPNNSVIVVASSLEHDKAFSIIEKHLGDWQKNNVELPARVKLSNIKDGYHEVRLGAQNQEAINIIFNYKDLSKRELILSSLVNERLGGGMTSLLWEKLRNDLGISYTAYSARLTIDNEHIYTIYANVSPENTELCLDAINGCISELKTKEGMEKHFDIAKKALMFGMANAFESNAALVSAITNRVIRGLELDFYDETIAILNSCTIEELIDIAKKIYQKPCTVISKI